VLTLINTNRMTPPIAPIGLDYVAGAARRAGIQADLVDLALAADPDAALKAHFAGHRPRLVGLTFRNVDDCFWPSAQWFVPDLAETVKKVRGLSDSAVVLGGIGYSIFSDRILQHTGADFGIRGDGERAIVQLVAELTKTGPRLERVEGLVWRDGSKIRRNPPAWALRLETPTGRDAVDNAAYFRLGGQGGVETKRGCGRKCLYCADPLAKGPTSRLRSPREVADEFQSLLAQGIDVLHLCDAEFNIPAEHALAVCEELAGRGLGRRVRWYAYLAVKPFDAAMAAAMRRAGCVGINFTGDSASEAMLATYRQPHRREDIAANVRLCRERRIAVMIDLLLGGPGETKATLADTIAFMKKIGPDCVGAALGVRIYPGTGMVDRVMAEGPAEKNESLRRKYDGPVDFFRPTFYISKALGDQPAHLVRKLVGGDKRFFEPMPEAGPGDAAADYNYNDNSALVHAIAGGARGAYWDILRHLRVP
jgi:radical SAM superfamily enzyme YgiQ (UPF0313 family)